MILLLKITQTIEVTDKNIDYLNYFSVHRALHRRLTSRWHHQELLHNRLQFHKYLRLERMNISIVITQPHLATVRAQFQ